MGFHRIDTGNLAQEVQLADRTVYDTLINHYTQLHIFISPSDSKRKQ